MREINEWIEHIEEMERIGGDKKVILRVKNEIVSRIGEIKKIKELKARG